LSARAYSTPAAPPGHDDESSSASSDGFLDDPDGGHGEAKHEE